MTITIRTASAEDYLAICETMSQPQAQAQTLQLPLPAPELWKKRLAELPASDHCLVAEVDGKVVGQLSLHAISRSRRCRHVVGIGMAVHDGYHGRGIGSALMKAALDLAENWLQCTRIELTVFVDNAAAIALYRKFGFEIEGTHKKFAFRNGVFVDVHSMAKVTH